MTPDRRIATTVVLFALAFSFSIQPQVWGSNPDREYVGSETCQGCHEDQYASFAAFAKKSHSFDSVVKMQKGLTESELKECYACHTTGYGRPGGFESVDKTPQMKNAGCEVCHGPGSLHAESKDPGDIKGRLTVADCEVCHNAERVGAFRYKPLIFGGAH